MIMGMVRAAIMKYYNLDGFNSSRDPNLEEAEVKVLAGLVSS